MIQPLVIYRCDVGFTRKDEKTGKLVGHDQSVVFDRLPDKKAQITCSSLIAVMAVNFYMKHAEATNYKKVFKDLQKAYNLTERNPDDNTEPPEDNRPTIWTP
jgi:hypothetical protein